MNVDDCASHDPQWIQFTEPRRVQIVVSDVLKITGNRVVAEPIVDVGVPRTNGPRGEEALTVGRRWRKSVFECATAVGHSVHNRSTA